MSSEFPIGLNRVVVQSQALAGLPRGASQRIRKSMQRSLVRRENGRVIQQRRTWPRKRTIFFSADRSHNSIDPSHSSCHPAGTVSPEDLDLLAFVNSPEEGFEFLKEGLTKYHLGGPPTQLERRMSTKRLRGHAHSGVELLAWHRKTDTQ
jgi:hypothetical protein